MDGIVYAPVYKSAPISSTFQGHLDREPPSNAPGLDIAASKGSVIYAPVAGKITTCDWSDAGGRRMWLDCGSGVKMYFAHMEAVARLKNERVVAGEQLGWVGSTGHSTGPHLHWSVTYNGAYIDPMPIWESSVQVGSV